MKLLVRTCVAILVVASILLNVEQVQGQAGSEMEMSAVSMFGEDITFTAKLKSPVQLGSASIFIFDSIQAITYTQTVTFDANGVSEFHFDTRQNSLRPFTALLWRYDLTLADGNTFQSPTQSIRYEDNRFVWKSLDSNGLRVHWYNGDDAFGLAALNAGLAGVQVIQTMFTPDLSRPVDVYLYASENDLRGMLYPSAGWVAGHADSPTGVVMVIIAPGVNQNILMEQRIPHELMHVMFYRRIGAGYSNLPAWLREGVPMLAEVYPNPDYDSYLADAIARDRLIPIRDLCDSFSPQIDSAFLAYAESRSFTNYLRGRYGMDGLLDLANAYANGVDCERGTERTFGVSLAKLNREWVNSISGQNDWFNALGAFAPYIGLLCLVMLVPGLSIIGALRKKG